MTIGRTWSRRAIFALLLALTALLLSAVGASAHSYLLASEPSDGAFLAQAPRQVVLVFSSAVVPDFTNVDLVEAAGRRFPVRSVVVDKSLPLVVAVNLPDLPQGSYRLSFTTHDRVDLHQTAGSIVFGVGIAPAALQPVPAPAPARPPEVVGRWVGLAGLAALEGGLLIALLVLPALADSRPRRRVQSALFLLALGGSLLVFAGATALFLVQAIALGPDVGHNLQLLFTSTDYGSRWLASALLSGVLVIFLASLSAQAREGRVAGLSADWRRLGGWAVLTLEARTVLLALGLAGVAAVSGHSSNASGPAWLQTIIRAAHLASMGAWAGGVLALALAILLLRRSGDRSSGSALGLVFGFGPYAAAGLAVLVVTGLLLSGEQVTSLTALLSTTYGAVLIAKVVGAGLVACVALRHALLSWRGLRAGSGGGRAPRGLLATIGLEAAGALVLILLAAILGSSAPARGPQFEPRSADPVATLVTQENNALLASVSMKPNRAGPNLLSVQVVDTRRPALAPIESVTLLLQKPGTGSVAERLPTTRSGSRYDAGSVRLATGDLRVSVVVTRAGLGDTVIDVPWRVNGAEVQRAPVVISSDPLAPLVNLLALLVAVVFASVFALGIIRSRGLGRSNTGADPEPPSVRAPRSRPA